MKEHFSSRVTKLLVILALAIVASVMFVIVGCGGNTDTHTHTWVADSSKTNVEATCSTDGVNYFICSECGMTSTEPVPATGHTWADNGALQEEPATCTENGYFYRLCNECGYRETSSVIYATGHMLDLNTVTVTAPTCTADGTISGTCANGCGETVTLSADQIITSGSDANVKNYDEAALKAKATAAKEVWFNSDDEFLQTLGHDYHFKNNTYSCVTAFNDTSAEIFGEDAAKVASKYYWNYCDRCDTAFEVEAHTAPAGADPCQVAMNPNTNQALTVPAGYVAPAGSSEYAAAGGNYSYQCEECDNYIAQVDHSYKLMSLVSGTPNSKVDPAEWQAAPADAEFSCLYYEVCEWCGYSRISKPHTPSAAAPTCTEAVTCTVCNALVESALGHKNDMGGAFGDIKSGTVAATCTTGTITYMHCSRCDAREKQGEKIEWVLGENYTMTEANDAKGHTYVQDKVFDTSVSAVGCARPFWYQDVCSVCKEDVTGHIRVMQKPTVYTRSGEEGNYTYTAVTESTLKTGTAYFIVAVDGNYVPFKDITNYNNNKYQSGTEVLFYTDANGYYNRQPGGAHTWGAFLTKTADGELIDYQNNAQLTGFVMPTCKTDGKVLYQCSKCGEYAWMSVDLKTYTNAMHAAADGTAKASQYPAYDEAVKLAKYHDGAMVACGYHAQCEVCKTQEHDVQFAVSFSVALDKSYENVAVPSIDTFYGWTCLTDTTDQANLAKVKDELAADTEFTYEFFTDAAMQTAMTDADWAAIGEPNGEDAYSQFITVYVKATPKVAFEVKFDTTGLTESLAQNKAFAARTIYVAQENKDQVAPVVDGYVLHFYTDAEHNTEFNFATYDWDNATGTVTIYVG